MNMNTTYFPEQQNDFFKTLANKKIVDVRGLSRGSDYISILFSDGDAIKFYHSQDCCESVEVDDVYGCEDDLIDAILYDIELVQSNDRRKDKYDESYTWSFYKFRTSKGYVDVRWYGHSNGYYSDTVDVEYFNPHVDYNWEGCFTSY